MLATASALLIQILPLLGQVDENSDSYDAGYAFGRILALVFIVLLIVWIVQKIRG